MEEADCRFDEWFRRDCRVDVLVAAIAPQEFEPESSGFFYNRAFLIVVVRISVCVHGSEVGSCWKPTPSHFGLLDLGRPCGMLKREGALETASS